MVGEVGFEPTTPASRTLCASQAALLPERKAVLYAFPVSHARIFFGRDLGVEGGIIVGRLAGAEIPSKEKHS